MVLGNDDDPVFTLGDISFTLLQLKRAVIASDISPIVAWSLCQDLHIDDAIEALLMIQEMNRDE